MSSWRSSQFRSALACRGASARQAQANVQPDLADSYEPWLVEALLRKEWGGEESGWGLQAGLTSTPFRSSTLGPAWTPSTRSRLGARQLAVGGDQPRRHRRRVVARRRARSAPGLVSSAPASARSTRALARTARLGDRRWLERSQQRPAAAERNSHGDLRRARRSARRYALVTLSDPGERAALKVGYFDNRGDQNADGSWNTHFTTIGAVLHPLRISTSSSSTWMAKRGFATRPTTARCARSMRCCRIASIASRDGPLRRFRLDDLDGGNSTSRARRRHHGCVRVRMGSAAPDGRRVHLARQQAPGQHAERTIARRLAAELSVPLLMQAFKVHLAFSPRPHRARGCTRR